MLLNRTSHIFSQPDQHLLIKGVVLKENIPLSCDVFVYLRKNGGLINKTISSNNGDFVVFGSVNSENYIVATDPSKEHQPATQDNVK
ncbi:MULTISPECIES: hypothetical protein [Acinetobacter]|uniref:hypothetical protein n=1 Tax=Acinetobacter TaxID=469 RepID=UPI00257E3BA1|nr:hypothetical protein [Acinetobacter sp. UBA5984]